jgi:hypothetical protein
MINKIEERIIKVGPKQAEKLLEHNILHIQRPIRQLHVDELSTLMSEGLFLTGDIALAKLEYNGGQTILVNGQHQCRAIIDSEQSVDVHFAKYSVDDPFELSTLYRQFDNHAARSLADSIRPEAYALEIKWPTRLTSLVVSAAKYREGQPKMKKQNAVTLLGPYRAHGDFICSIMAPDGTLQVGHLLRAIVVCAMMVTWEKNRQDAYEFWTQVQNGENLKKHMPSYQLREFLKSINVNFGQGTRGYKRIAPDHEIMSRCITAWNAYRKNTPTKLQYYSEKPIPKAI